MRNFLILLALLIVSGCVQVIPEIPEIPKLIRLTPCYQIEVKPASSKQHLSISEPQTSLLLNTSKIRLERVSSQGLTYFDFIQNAEWSSRLPSMIQDIFVEFFQKSSRWLSVHGSQPHIKTDIILHTQLHDFHVVESVDSHVKISWTTSLISTKNNHVLFSQRFTQNVSLEKIDRFHIVKAFEECLANLMVEMSLWIDGFKLPFNKLKSVK